VLLLICAGALLPNEKEGVEAAPADGVAPNVNGEAAGLFSGGWAPKVKPAPGAAEVVFDCPNVLVVAPNVNCGIDEAEVGVWADPKGEEAGGTVD